MAQPLVNGQVFNYANIELNVMGVMVQGVTAIKYSDEQEVEDVMGLGPNPVGRSMGGITRTGAITFGMEELDKLEAASPTGRIQDLPEFTIVVSFVRRPGTPIVTHKLTDCRFKTNGRDMSQGDQYVKTEVALAIGNIQFK